MKSVPEQSGLIWLAVVISAKVNALIIISTKSSAIEQGSEAVPSVINVNVDDSMVSFDYTNECDVVKVREKLKVLGYPSIDETNSLTSKAKSFVSCATGKFSK